MIIKKLLLGSAAMLVTVAGARAADVIVPAAEPAEYVKVCDVYGEGFYYIPGTETCMQISGYVRFKYGVNSDSRRDIFGGDIDSDTLGISETRVRLNFDVREETELGTLRAFARVQATQGNTDTGVGTLGGSGDAAYGMDLGYIQLGGLTMGYLDTLWTEGDGVLTDTDLAVGDFQTNRVSYTASFGAWSVAGSVEDDATGNFAPNGVLRAAYESDLFSAYVAGSVDAGDNGGFVNGGRGFFVTDNFDIVGGGIVTGDRDAAFAVKGGISFKPVQDGELKFEGSYAFDPSVYSTIDLFNAVEDRIVVAGVPGGSFFPSVNVDVPVEWQVGAGYAQKFGKLGLGLSGALGETFDYYDPTIVGGAVTVENFGSADYYKVVGNVGYEITNNFDVLGEVSYTNLDFADRNIDQTSGFIQFVRSF